jgi:hypothetical protein
MAGEIHTTATYPGAARISSASIRLGHGISPSVAQLTIAPQDELPDETGTLRFQSGEVVIEFVDCRLDFGTVARTRKGRICRVTVLDRRWRWQFGQISGNYNVRRDDSSLADGRDGAIDTERTPRELARLCLAAMGETDFDLDDLPNDARPSVEWDRIAPAAALAALCDELGCRVVLGLDNRVALRRTGQGAELPFDRAKVTDDDPAINLFARPGKLAVVGGPSRFQVDFRLEAVGLSRDGTESPDALLPIDELSYRPEGGWSQVDLPYMTQVAAASRALAQRSVFRYYRIRTPLDVPGYEGPHGTRVDHREQVVPIEDEQVVTFQENGQLANRPAMVYGVWHVLTGGVANSVAVLLPPEAPGAGGGLLPYGAEYRGQYRIDRARGLVIFDEPVYRNTHPSATGSSGHEVTIGPAELVLRAACHVRDEKTGSLVRATRTRALGASGGKDTRHLTHDELVLTHVPRYSSAYTVESLATNRNEVDRQADLFLDIVEREYAETSPGIRQYSGLVKIEPDGAIEHVGFEVGPGGTKTTAGRCVEPPMARPSLAGRRRIERQSFPNGAAALRPRALSRLLKSDPHSQPRP